MTNKNKHPNYEILNLLGYGLAKFDRSFIEEFNVTTKTDFYKLMVQYGIADTSSVVKNRQDLFDPFFENNRKGWWQKGDAYIHRKVLIDNLFGRENVKAYSDIVKIYLKENYGVDIQVSNVKPIIKSRFKKLQETGLEAEIYFINNYQDIKEFRTGSLDDARLLGDGYDFQVNVDNKVYLAEIKGIRLNQGRFRMTKNEYIKAIEYKEDYILTVVLNMNDIPRFLTIEDPIKNLSFDKKIISSEYEEYYLKEAIS